MDSQRRTKSVKRLKRMIIVTLLTLILLPTVLCVILFARTRKLERRIEELYEAKLAQEVELSLRYDTYENHTVPAEELPAPEEQELLGEKLTDEESQDETTLVENQGEDSHCEEEKVCIEDTLPENVRRVYLTFDDGPSANTDQILDILSEYGVKATFFVVAKTDSKSLLRYQRIVEEGHTLGLHSYSHKYSEIYASLESFSSDITKLQKFLQETTGIQVNLYRFPGGSSNTVSCVPKEELIAYLNENGIRYMDWNIVGRDATGTYVSPEAICENCIEGINKQTNVILLHDGADKNNTVEALPMILDRIAEMENTVVLPISDATTEVHHR